MKFLTAMKAATLTVGHGARVGIIDSGKGISIAAVGTCKGIKVAGKATGKAIAKEYRSHKPVVVVVSDPFMVVIEAEQAKKDAASATACITMMGKANKPVKANKAKKTA